MVSQYIEIIWTEEQSDHIRTRSTRYSGALNIEPEWTIEAVNDPDVAWIEPDPASVGGEGIRIIGYSRTAKILITVLVIRGGGELYGMTAWKSGRRDMRRYRGG